MDLQRLARPVFVNRVTYDYIDLVEYIHYGKAWVEKLSSLEGKLNWPPA